MSEISMMSMDPQIYPLIGLDQSGEINTQQHQPMAVWGDKEISALLNFDFTTPSTAPHAMNHYTTTDNTTANNNYFYFSSPASSSDSPIHSPPSSNGSVSPFSIPSPIEMNGGGESTLFHPQQHQPTYVQQPYQQQEQHSIPLADENVNIDAKLFEEINPLLLPELEKILASTASANGYMSPSSSPPSSQPASPPTASSSRKRIREDTILLPREELLTMTSQEIEDYVAEVKAAKSLTASEEKDLKRQRRLVKNREYASQSRTRRKQHMDDVEKQLDAARQEIALLKQHNTSLSSENTSLKKQLHSIATTIKRQILSNSSSGRSSPTSSSSLSSSTAAARVMRPVNVATMEEGAMMNGGTGVAGGEGTEMPYGFDVNSIVSTATEVFHRATSVGKSVASGHTAKTVSVCMLAILFMVFTFGSFWPNEQCGVNPLLPTGGSSWSIRDVKDHLSFASDISDTIAPSISSSSPSSSPSPSSLSSSSSSIVCSYDPNVMLLESAWKAAVCMANNFTKDKSQTP